MLTNEQVLTRGGRSVAAKKRANRVDEVKFDFESRADFITGFHKRKLQRRADAKKKAEDLNRQHRLEERRKLREQKKAKLDQIESKFTDRNRELAGEISDDSEDDTKPTASKKCEEVADENNSDDEFQGFTDSSGILKKKRIGDATVTYEQLNLDPYVDVSRSEEVLAESTRKAQEYAKYVESLERPKPKPKPKKKKFKYMTPKRRV